jgi:ketosteroid isomerase-like protein
VSQENVDLVRVTIEAWLRGDTPRALGAFAETVVVIQPPTQADARTYVGHDGVLQAMADWISQWNEWKLDLRSLTDADPDVVAVFDQRGRGKISGAEVATEFGCVFTVEDRTIVRWQMFFSEQEARGAAGLDE